MTSKSMIADLTELAVSVDEAPPSESQASYVEGPPIEPADSWGQRCERLLRRLEHGMNGTPLAARSACAVAQGLQRARAVSEEFGNPCSLDCEQAGGADALLAEDSGGTASGEEGRTGRRNAGQRERLASREKLEV